MHCIWRHVVAINKSYIPTTICNSIKIVISQKIKTKTQSNSGKLEFIKLLSTEREKEYKQENQIENGQRDKLENRWLKKVRGRQIHIQIDKQIIEIFLLLNYSDKQITEIFLLLNYSLYPCVLFRVNRCDLDPAYKNVAEKEVSYKDASASKN